MAGGMSFGEVQGVQGGPVRGRGRGKLRHDYSYQHPRGRAHARLPRCTSNAAEHVGFVKTTFSLETDDPFKRRPMRGQNPSKIGKTSSGLGAQTIMHTNIVPGESPSGLEIRDITKIVIQYFVLIFFM